MIGDDVRDDIDGAIKAKMEGILVQTGKYIAGDEDKISLSKDCVAQDFSNAVDMILSSRWFLKQFAFIKWVPNQCVFKAWASGLLSSCKC